MATCKCVCDGKQGACTVETSLHCIKWLSLEIQLDKAKFQNPSSSKRLCCIMSSHVYRIVIQHIMLHCVVVSCRVVLCCVVLCCVVLCCVVLCCVVLCCVVFVSMYIFVPSCLLQGWWGRWLGEWGPQQVLPHAQIPEGRPDSPSHL